MTNESNIKDYSDDELNEILYDLRLKKRDLSRKITDLDTKIIGIKEELFRREEKKSIVRYEEDDVADF